MVWCFVSHCQFFRGGLCPALGAAILPGSTVLEQEMEEESGFQSNGRRKASSKRQATEPDPAEADYDPTAALPHDSFISQYAVVKRKSDPEAVDGSAVTITIRSAHKAVKNSLAHICGNFNPATGAVGASMDLDMLLYARPMMRLLTSNDEQKENQEEEPYEELKDPAARAEAALGRLFQTRVGQYAAQLRNQVAGGGNSNLLFLSEFIKWADEEAKRSMDSRRDALLAKQLVQFSSLADVLRSGTLVSTTLADFGPGIFGARVLASYYSQSKTIDKTLRSFVVALECAIATASGFALIRSEHMVDEFWDPVPINELSIRPLDADTKQFLTERGRMYAKLSRTPSYMQYSPSAFFLKSRPVRTGGRLIIDTALAIKSMQGFPCGGSNAWTHAIHSLFRADAQRIGPTNGQNTAFSGFGDMNFYARRMPMGARGRGNSPDELGETLPEVLLPITWPAVPAFSFSVKDWGYALLDGITDIQFDEKAFDQLVLEQERKELIAAIVSHSQVVFRDIISGKGGGSIFLLHGPPGVGKTLTAEAVAEMLHRPLYPVSMAELGTTPAELESGLSKILELATEWRAIVLMDEADIFLERRSQNEVVRNAMVGVLLRQLEYYPGVLFLTSNRVDVFDEALHSRITVALRYEELSETIRAQVWNNLLAAANIALAEHIPQLASFQLNGRQIKNSIALAQGLARSSGSEITLQHLLRTIAVIMQFKSDLLRK